MSKQHQQEIDGLRDELRRLRSAHDAAESELAALRSGKPERSAIAESAEIHAAERDDWKRRYEELADFNADLDTLLRHYESNTAPQADLLGRVFKRRSGVRQ
jgi:predicted nuclease with TOPRIM domain